MLYEVESVRRFVGLKLSGPLPDETTMLNIRHLLEEHELGQSLFEEINGYLESQGLRLREGTIVDASIIEAPSSTKNRAGERDPEMHQTKKGNEWRFGMKVHVGADAETGVVHSMTTTPAGQRLAEKLTGHGMQGTRFLLISSSSRTSTNMVAKNSGLTRLRVVCATRQTLR